MNISDRFITDLRDSQTRHSGYERATLVDLARSIFHGSDREALQELHNNRTLFNSRADKRLVMAEFLLELKDRDVTFQWCGRDAMAVDGAYDLTLAKFLNLPSAGRDGGHGDEDGPDCRYYYKAFYDHVTESLQKQPPTTVIGSELRATEILQRMVTRHFYLSCLECRRRTLKLVRRYCWRINGHSLTVWLPLELAGSRCRTWLGANVPNVDPTRPGERDRIQAVIDRHLSRRKIFSLDRLSRQEHALSADSDPIRSLVEEGMSARGLAGFVAEEKAENIAEQRPSIRALGRNRLRELITTVFDSIAQDQYNAERIARDYDLSKATFSRFAGSRWASDEKIPGSGDIPDLWRNTAHVLASHEDFVAVARKAGVWRRVRQVILTGDDQKGTTR